MFRIFNRFADGNRSHAGYDKWEHLRSLLASVFDEVEVDYAIKGGLFRRLGLKSWSVRKPLQTGLSMIGNVVNTIQSSRPGLKDQAVGTRHLVATARKQA